MVSGGTLRCRTCFWFLDFDARTYAYPSRHSTIVRSGRSIVDLCCGRSMHTPRHGEMKMTEGRGQDGEMGDVLSA